MTKNNYLKLLRENDSGLFEFPNDCDAYRKKLDFYVYDSI